LLYIWLEYINTKHKAYAEIRIDVLWLQTIEIKEREENKKKKDTGKDIFLEFTG
jgi:hypothetical protein